MIANRHCSIVNVNIISPNAHLHNVPSPHTRTLYINYKYKYIFSRNTLIAKQYVLQIYYTKSMANHHTDRRGQMYSGVCVRGRGWIERTLLRSRLTHRNARYKLHIYCGTTDGRTPIYRYVGDENFYTRAREPIRRL